MTSKLAAAILLLAVACSAADLVTVRVKRVVDGDTLRVTIAGVEAGVRIWGIDTPERGQDGFAEAKAALVELAPPGAEVKLEMKGIDRYGRNVARVVSASGEDVGRHLVCAGHARWYRRYAPGAVDLAACAVYAAALQ